MKREKKQIGEKRGFYQPVAKYEKQANISTRTSAKSSSVLKNKKEEKEKRNKEETTTKSNLLKWTVCEEKRHWIKQQKPTWNQWKRSY